MTRRVSNFPPPNSLLAMLTTREMLEVGETIMIIALLVISFLNPLAFGQPLSTTTFIPWQENETTSASNEPRYSNHNGSTFTRTTPGKRLVFKRPIGRQPVINVPIQDYAQIVTEYVSQVSERWNETRGDPSIVAPLIQWNETEGQGGNRTKNSNTPIMAALIQSNQTEGQGGNGTGELDWIDPRASWDEMEFDAENGSVPENGKPQKLMNSLREIWDDIRRSPLMMGLIGGSLVCLFIMGCSCGVLMRTWCCSRHAKNPGGFSDMSNPYRRMTKSDSGSAGRLGWQFHAGNDAPSPDIESNHSKVNVYQIQDPRIRKNSPISRSDANLAVIQPVFRPSRPVQYWNTSLPSSRHSAAVSLQDAGGYTLPHVLRNGNPDLGHGLSLKSIGSGRTEPVKVSAPSTMRLSLLKDQNENVDEMVEDDGHDDRAESPSEAFPPPPPPEQNPEELVDKRVSSSGMTSFLRNGPKSHQSKEMSTYDWDNVQHI